MKKFIKFMLISSIINQFCQHMVLSAPLSQANKTIEHPAAGDKPPQEKPEIDLPYGKYVREVMDFLEQDPSFKKYLETAKEEDIGNGRMAKQLQYVSHHIRNKLDEVKRLELNRLRNYNRRMHELSNGVYSDNEMDKLGMDRSALSRPLHVNSNNPNSFEVEDLMNLIKKTTEDLEESNRQRRGEFKEYEMAKEFERRENMKQMDEAHRQQAEKEHDEQLKKHKEHPKLHHPGSKQQLEEVWENKDNLPRDEFDPETLFNLHDLDGDGIWGQHELEAMFIDELNKMYDKNDDPRERAEEMNRMREHVMNETDTNRDGMIDKREFKEMVNKQDFNRDPGWEGLDEQQLYNDQEFDEYQRTHLPPGYPPPPVYMPQGGVPPGSQYQYSPPNGYPMGAQPGYPPLQGNQIGQMPPAQYQGQQYPSGNPQQYQQPQFQQGQGQFQQPQFQQGQGQFQQPQFQQRAQHPQFQQGSQNPQFQQGVQNPQFQQGAQNPQFQQGAQNPQFQQGAQNPQFQQGAQNPQFQQGAQNPQFQQGVPVQQSHQPVAPSVPQGTTVSQKSVDNKEQAHPLGENSSHNPNQQESVKKSPELTNSPQQLNNAIH